jgi:ketosteroid isomerase-like protein
MSENKSVVELYIDAYNRLDHEAILGCLADDIEWIMPGAFHVYGKEGVDGQIESDCFSGPPAIVITRLTEENDIVVAEGTVTSPMTDGSLLDAAFCDVFEMSEAKIRKLTSYLAPISDGDPSSTA